MNEFDSPIQEARLDWTTVTMMMRYRATIDWTESIIRAQVAATVNRSFPRGLSGTLPRETCTSRHLIADKREYIGKCIGFVFILRELVTEFGKMKQDKCLQQINHIKM